MNAHSEDIERRNAAAIGIWENEGGALRPDPLYHQFGRRIEADRSWTVYHVFTGVPAHVEGGSMTGLTRSVATRGMQSLNRETERTRSTKGRS